MTTVVQVPDVRTPPPPPSRDVRRPPTVVLLAAVAVVVLRLPFVSGWLGKDEAGFLTVAQQWRAGGSSLYGNYWVDRPPLLITIFRVAAALGGTVPLRLIGIGAAVVAVLAIAHAAHTLGGRRGASWAAVTAAAFLVSPQAGASEVNGELLAAPFVAIGIAASLAMLATASARRALSASVPAGAAALLAVLVKQNMLDVFVFTGVLLLLRIRGLGAARIGVVSAGFLGGAVTAGLVMAVWTRAQGTSLSGVWFAMYRFRVEADAVMTADRNPATELRSQVLLQNAVGSGMVLVAVLLLATLVRLVRARAEHAADPASGLARAVPFALVATLGYDLTSIYLGKSYWIHYLVQLAVPLALSAGVAVAHRPRISRLVVVAVAVAAAWAVVPAALHPGSPGGNRLGAAIAAVARPGDTLVTVWGHADVTHASGLTSPYPYLWSLPAETLDPRVTLLTATLTGSHAPTWFVSWSGTGRPGVDTSALKSALHHDYHRVAEWSGHVVYLHDGLQRPKLPGSSGSPGGRIHPRPGDQDRIGPPAVPQSQHGTQSAQPGGMQFDDGVHPTGPSGRHRRCREMADNVRKFG